MSGQMWAPEHIAERHPYTRAISAQLVTPEVFCVHTMVGTLPGSWSWSNRPGGTYWPFGTSGLGECWQCHDARFRSAANLHGNPYVIALENADMGPGFAPWNARCGFVPPFTAAQETKIVQLMAWALPAFGIPAVLIPDTVRGRRGVGYHRQGIDPWRVMNGVLWSLATGKCCPDVLRIHQLVNSILVRVRAILIGNPMPPPPTREWLDMVSLNEFRAETRQIVREEIGRQRTAYRMVKVGWQAGDPLYLSDLVSFKIEIPYGGPLDMWCRDLQTLSGLSWHAHRLDQKVIDQIHTVAAIPGELERTLLVLAAKGDSPLHTIVGTVLAAEVNGLRPQLEQLVEASVARATE